MSQPDLSRRSPKGEDGRDAGDRKLWRQPEPVFSGGGNAGMRLEGQRCITRAVMRRWPVGARDSARRIQARHRAACPRSDGGAMGGGRIEKHHFIVPTPFAIILWN